MDLNCNLIRFDFSSLSKFCHSNKSFRLIFKSKELRERPVGLLTGGGLKNPVPSNYDPAASYATYLFAFQVKSSPS